MKITAVPTPAQLNLVDLAGSERASVAQTQTQLKETRNINKSLGVLIDYASFECILYNLELFHWFAQLPWAL